MSGWPGFGFDRILRTSPAKPDRAESNVPPLKAEDPRDLRVLEGQLWWCRRRLGPLSGVGAGFRVVAHSAQHLVDEIANLRHIPATVFESSHPSVDRAHHLHVVGWLRPGLAIGLGPCWLNLEFDLSIRRHMPVS